LNLASREAKEQEGGGGGGKKKGKKGKGGFKEDA